MRPQTYPRHSDTSFGQIYDDGPVLPPTYRSKERPPCYISFGFASEDTFMSWMNSDGFKPYYCDLQKGLSLGI
jgi:hypothetical protein